MIQKFLRVDHAGEVGAYDIYAGQMAILGRSDIAPVLQVFKLLVVNILSWTYLIYNLDLFNLLLLFNLIYYLI